MISAPCPQKRTTYRATKGSGEKPFPPRKKNCFSFLKVVPYLGPLLERHVHLSSLVPFPLPSNTCSVTLEGKGQGHEKLLLRARSRGLLFPGIRTGVSCLFACLSCLPVCPFCLFYHQSLWFHTHNEVLGKTDTFRNKTKE